MFESGVQSRMILPDNKIAQHVHYLDDGIDIDPYDESNLQPASYDLTLGTEFVTFNSIDVVNNPVDTSRGLPPEATETKEASSIVIPSNKMVLAHTVETVSVPFDMAAIVKGRSSVGRLGVIPHTAGWIDPGFEGQITLEIVNHAPAHDVKLDAGDRIAQIVFMKMSGNASTPYGEKDDAKYQGQTGATGSRIEEDE